MNNPPAYSASPKEPKPEKKPTIYTERGAVIPLQQGKTVLVKGIGNSMTPILLSGQVVTVVPIKTEDELKKGDIVLCKVNGKTFIHKITAVKGNRYQISNNHRYVNGWTVRSRIYGRYVK